MNRNDISDDDRFCHITKNEAFEESGSTNATEQPSRRRSVFDSGEAFLAGTRILLEQADWITTTRNLIGSGNDLMPHQWAQFMTTTLAFKPDLILEIGRGNGNSTCCFTQALHLTGTPNARVVSFCRSSGWRTRKRPSLENVLPPEWFSPLLALEGELGDVNFADHLDDARRVLVLWDGHGWEVAQIVLGRLMPLLADREHLVMMHDIGDLDCNTPETLAYTNRMWRGSESEGAMLYLPPFITNVAQAICAIDFCYRNGIELHSAESEISRAINCAEPPATTDLEALPPEFVHGPSYWVWFSLQEGRGPFHFPPLESGYGRTKKKRRQAPSPQVQLPTLPPSERITQLEEQVEMLMNSRWRRLGRFLGLAKPAPWEK